MSSYEMPKTTRNAALAAAMRELRRSNATSRHDPRPNRQRTRRDARRRAIRESQS